MASTAGPFGRKSFTATSLFSFFLSVYIMVKDSKKLFPNEDLRLKISLKKGYNLQRIAGFQRDDEVVVL